MTFRSVLPYFHGAFMLAKQTKKPALGRAVLTDVQFWIPVVVLALGLILLVSLH
ncbi:hypothetical protein [Terriglobus sp.]|uniref:hypothetical protein n=1 Tax=Terriglobus sp. TaxID=1889013 RepID=UPI003B00A767